MLELVLLLLLFVLRHGAFHDKKTWESVAVCTKRYKKTNLIFCCEVIVNLSVKFVNRVKRMAAATMPELSKLLPGCNIKEVSCGVITRYWKI